MMSMLFNGVLLGLFACDHRRDLDQVHTPQTQTQTQTQTEPEVKVPNVDEKLGTAHDTELKQLHHSKTAPDGIKALVKIGNPALASLKTAVEKSSSVVAKGWAIQAIFQINTPESLALLKEIEQNDKLEDLTRNWAAAALINSTKTMKELIASLDLLKVYPSLERPISMKIDSLEGGINALQALELVIKIPELKTALAPKILESDPTILIKAMLTHADMNIRRQSAAYLATMGRSNKSVVPALLKIYDFDPKAQEVIWKGGPLYVPSINWDKENGTALFSHLFSWYLFCEKNNLRSEQQQVYNNMRSVQLLYAIGMNRNLGYTPKDVVQNFTRVVGQDTMKKLLEEQGLLSQYQSAMRGR